MEDIELRLAQFRKRTFGVVDRLIYKEQLELLDLYPKSAGAATVIRDLEHFADVSQLSKKLRIHLQRQFLAGGSSEPRKLLEICAGSGWLSRQLAETSNSKLRNWKFTASDLRVPEAASGSNIDWKVADATALPFAEKSFDLVICVQAVHHFSPKILAKVLSEAARVGKLVSVFDLRRTFYGVAMMSLIAPFYPKEFIADGIISHRRAYSIREIQFIIDELNLPLIVGKFLPVGMLIESRRDVQC